MPQARPYYAEKGLSAAFYEVVTAADRHLSGDLDAYAALAPTGGSILELGTGSGRLAVPLAERGFTVTGVDLAPAMLAQARIRRGESPADVAARLDFRQGDMTALDLKRTFDAVICTYFTLAHVPAGAAWRNTFAVAAKHLAPGGRAAFHLPRLEVMRAGAPADMNLPVLDEPLADGGRLRLFLRERSFRESIGRLDQVLEYQVIDGRGRPRTASLERLTYYIADPGPYAAAAGLVPAGAPVPIGDVGDIHIFAPA